MVSDRLVFVTKNLFENFSPCARSLRAELSRIFPKEKNSKRVSSSERARPRNVNEMHAICTSRIRGYKEASVRPK